jgi:putative selenium metabolism hydrolase
MPSPAETLNALVRSHEPEILDFARRILKTQSFSGQERDLALLIETEMRMAGFDDVRIDALGNVIGRMGDGPCKLQFDAHIDTVEAESTGWRVNPFAAVIEEGLLYGRGASDEKAAMASMIWGVALARQAGLLAGTTIWVTATVLEESCDGLAITHLVEKEGLKPDFVVICEPTSLDVYRGQRGRIELRITAHGRSAHAAHKSRGDSAILKMAATILNLEVVGEHFADDAFLGRGTVVVSAISSKAPSLNSVPYECVAYVDRRITTGETRESVVREVQACLADPANMTVEVLHYEDISWTGLEVAQEKYFPTWVLASDHPLVKAAVAAATTARGRAPAVSRWLFSTNGVATMGRYGIPTVGFGPGDEWLAHAVDENVRVSDLYEAAVFYALLPSELVSRVQGIVPQATRNGDPAHVTG